MGGSPSLALNEQGIDHDLDSTTVQARYAYWYSDRSNDLAEVLALDQAQWTQVESLGSYGFTKGEYWIHLTLSQPKPSLDSHLVRFIHPVHDVVDIHVLSPSGKKLNEWHLGDTVQNIQRPIQEKNPSFEIVLNEHPYVDVYIRVSGMNAMWLTMEVMTEKAHHMSVQVEVLVSGMIYGILLVMMLYNLGIAVSINDKSYYIYVAYVASYIVLILSISGDGFYYLWSSSPQFNSWLMPVAATFLMVPSALFPLYLLNIKKYAPRLVLVFKLMIICSLLFIGAAPFLGPADFLSLINVFSFIASLIVLSSGIYLSIKKVPVALIYTVAWSVLLAGLAILTLSSLGVIESNIFTRYANMLGVVVESILLSLALAQRIRLERKERIVAIKQSLKLKEESVQNKKMFQELFDDAPIGMFRFSIAGELVAVNQYLAKLIGYDHPEQVMKVGTNIHNIFGNSYDMFAKALKHEPIIDQESLLTTMSGEIRFCSVTLRRFTQNNIEIIEGFISDITARKQAENTQDILETERMASMEQLVTGVAHEVNAPLGNNVVSVSHLSELLTEIDGQMDEGILTKKTFKEFVGNSQSLMSIMSKNLAQISSLVKRFKLISVNRLGTEKINFDFVQEAEDVKNYYDNYDHKNKNIRVNINGHGHSMINSYPSAWKIILEQLFENSIIHGFTQDQSEKIIDIDIHCKNEMWTVCYRDNGKGVSEEILPRIFDPFVTSKRGNLENAGLGMYRVYNIVNQVLKGQVHVEPGKGFKIVIEFK
jgi:PAS domain S-box-containing protein